MDTINKKDFRIIIAGSRSFNNYELLKRECNIFLSDKTRKYNIIIISGGARGADLLGEKYSSEEGFDLEIYPAQWDKYGKSAGFRRNEQMGNIADALIAFWDGKSHGTKHMIDIMKEKNLSVRVVEYETTDKEK